MLLKSISSTDQVIDYTQEDFTKNGQRYDLILDNVANRSLSDYKRALSPKGVYVINGYSPVLMFQGPLISMTGGKKIVTPWLEKMNKKDLVFIKELLEAGKVVPVIDRRYPLEQTAEAHRYVEKGHKKGNVVITVVGQTETSDNKN